MNDTPVTEAPQAQPSPLGANQAYCRGCGAVIHAEAAACPKCGAPQRPVRAQAPASAGGKDRAIAAIFALLLGGIGVHKFYLGKWVQGLFYLLFFWTIIPGLIAFIEGIIYLTLSDDEFRRRYP